jgi:hypothetical protein
MSVLVQPSIATETVKPCSFEPQVVFGWVQLASTHVTFAPVRPMA